ncbi:TrkH family potassium uptake protein [Paenibacillus thailandensis]|uniref:TrkH family potassium uptake protein n=1 Tax=Paenibacillus thailandensis TaxID=393250 RepID=A0ABW5QSC2_9BACL
MSLVKSIYRKLNPPQLLTLGFLLIITLGALLLSMPQASAGGTRTPFLDALFTATSAACVTGLVVVDTGTHYSVFGQVVILTLMQVGGLGFMTMATMFALMFRKRISLKDRLVLQEAMNQHSLEGIISLIRKVLLYSLLIELAGALILAARWSAELPLGEAAYLGVFHSISMFTNAGFDIMGALHGPYSGMTRHVDDPVVNVVVMLLIFLGGVGFVVLAEIVDFQKRKKLSLHAKVVLSTTLLLFAVGTIVIFVFEFTNAKTTGQLSFSGRLLSAMFQSVSPRSGGANTLDISQMRQATQFFIVLLMFIGASPGSSGGGIKVTTFAILAAAVYTMMRGKQDVVLFRHRLQHERVYKALTMTLASLFVIILFTMLLSVTEPNASLLMILFEVTSAFGTCGLSMGLTTLLSEPGKVLIIIMMFIGRLGPLTLAYSLKRGNEKELFKYPEGKITIG